MDHVKQDAALNVERARRQFQGKVQERGRSHSKLRGCKCIDYHCYGKKGYIKHDCYAWKREQKGKRQDSHKEEPQKTKITMNIEKINIVTNDSDDDIIFMPSLFAKFLTTLDDAYYHNWTLDSSVSFHVTPHRE